MKFEVVGSRGLEHARRRLGEIAVAMEEAPPRIARRAGGILEVSIKEQIPEKTGKTRRSAKARVEGSEVRFSVGGAGIMLLRGTRPHEEAPRGQAMALPGGIFTSRVQHPGTRADNFRDRGAEEAQPALEELLRATGTGILRGGLAGVLEA